MKRCPECRRDYYDDSLLYCLDDGTALLEGPASGDEPVTAIYAENKPSSDPPNSHKRTDIFGGRSASGEIRRHKIAAVLIGLVAAVVLAGFAYGLYRFFERPAMVNDQRSANVETRRLTGDGKTTNAAISPDGKFLVFSKLEGNGESLWIKQILTDSNIPVQTSDDLVGFSDLAFSPDGNFVYFNGRGKQVTPRTVYRVPTLGGTPTKVLSDTGQIRFSPDGRSIAFGRFDAVSTETAIFIANADGTNERKLASRTGRQFFNAAPVFSPDGKFLSTSTGDDDLLPAPDEGVVLISVADGSKIEVGKTRWTAVPAVAWHPSGDSLIAVASDYDGLPGQLWEISYPSGNVRRLTNNLNGYNGVSITADGRSIVTMEKYTRSAVWVSPDLDPAKAKGVMPNSGDTWGMSWTPDNRIVYVSDQSGDAEVWIMNSDGSAPRQLTRDRIFKGFPDVSADGRYIIYVSAEGSGRIVRMNIDGSDPMPLTPTGNGQDNADISPDDSWVIYSAWVEGNQRILRAPLSGGEAVRLTEVSSTEPRYSPDGSQFACFVMNEEIQNWAFLAIYPADGGQPIKKFDIPPGTNTSRGPYWKPDGQAITLIISKGEKLDMWAQPLDGGPVKQLTDFEMPVMARRDYSRDGKRIALVRGQAFSNAVMVTGFR